MKLKFTRLVLTFCLLLFVSSLFSQQYQVYVSGYVKNTSGAAINNKLVTIVTDSVSGAINPCKITHSKRTNANGFYSDTLSCNSGAITAVRISTENCDGSILSTYKAVGSTRTVECNFIVCILNVPVNCASSFTFQSVGKNVSFSSANSIVSAGDSIISRVWNFGDGAGITAGNIISPTHAYNVAGIYTVCLSTKTAKNCTDTFCASIVVKDTIPPTPVTCQAYFTYTTYQALKAQFNSNVSQVSTGDSIISRLWDFGDSTSTSLLTGNIKEPNRTYIKGGSYTVCLTINTRKGCTSRVCLPIVVRDSIAPNPIPTACKSYFQVIGVNKLKINLSSINAIAGPNDTIVKRIWAFGDGTGISAGNYIDTNKTYTVAGTYTVCLRILTSKKCESNYCMSVTVRDSVPPTTIPICKAYFTYVPQSTTVKFFSHNSSATQGDSIISRSWNFGDSTSTSILNGNVVEPTRVYARPGIYNVCLTIKTAKGCTNTYCYPVIATQVNSACVPQYFYTRPSSKQVKFTSTASWVPANDSIVSRIWNFGDGTTLSGNVVDPLKTYLQNAIYNVCLSIRTAKGCTNQYCNVVNIQDTVPGSPTGTNSGIKIVKINPVPAQTNISVTIWSITDNVRGDVGIYDIYGVKKWSGVRNLMRGNNVYSVNIGFLLSGPYFIRVNTILGNDSKPFYKL